MFKSHLRRSVRRPVSSGYFAPSTGEVVVPRSGRCVALVDARFLGWLLQSPVGRDGAESLPTPVAVQRLLDLALRHAGLEIDLLRIYWYVDAQQTVLVNDLVSRLVQNPDSDGGLSLSRAMQSDLIKLADGRAADHLLVVSDDERLIHGVDHAQLCGLSVHVLVDEAGADVERLVQEDPSWARLLMQADRRVVLQSADTPLWSTGVQGFTAGSGASESPVQSEDDLKASVLAHLQAWWDEEPETHRLDLQNELQHSRSIPQEVDRQLLLRLSRALGHPLTWPEKKLMREGVRNLVLPPTPELT